MKHILQTLIAIAASAAVSSAQNPIYLPQVADGVQAGGIAWRTIIAVTNPAATGSTAASGTVTFTQDNGTAFNVSFTDVFGQPVGSGNTIPFQVSGAQTRLYVSAATAALNTGSATVTSDLPVAAAAIFQEESSPTGNVIAAAGVPPATPLTRQAIIFYERGGSDTGVAIANPNTANAAISLQLLTTDGVAALPPASITLAGNRHTARFVSQLFPNSRGLFGTMQITSSVPLATTALYFNGNGTFATVPVIPLASLTNPAIEWLVQRPWLNPITSLAKLVAFGREVFQGIRLPEVPSAIGFQQSAWNRSVSLPRGGLGDTEWLNRLSARSAIRRL